MSAYHKTHRKEAAMRKRKQRASETPFAVVLMRAKQFVWYGHPMPSFKNASQDMIDRAISRARKEQFQ